MKLPANFYRPLAIGAPLPLRELPVRPERMKHFAIAPSALPRSAGFAPAPAVGLLLLEEPLKQRFRLGELARIDEQRSLLGANQLGIGSDPDARGFEGLVLSRARRERFPWPAGRSGDPGLARHLEVSLGGHVEPTALARHLADQEAVQDLVGQLLLRQGRLPRRLRPDRIGRRLCGGLRDRSSER